MIYRFLGVLIFAFCFLQAKSQPGSSVSPVVDTVARWEITDPFYPKFHVAPPYGWMNDPHPVFFQGAYHMFYQYSFVRDNPYGRIGLKPGERPQRTWGHAMSTDLLHWKHMPIALKASLHGRPNDPHVFSGVVVDNNGTGTCIYTINNIDIYMGTSKDKDLRSFTKYAGSPVVKGPPPGLQTSGNMRDPWVWKEGKDWYMIIGSGLAGNKGPVIPLYKSTDLINWEYLHPLYSAENSEFDLLGDAPFCECPAFFPLGNKYVLVFSDKTTYMVGRYENKRFIPEKRGRLDYGESPSVKDGGIYVPLFTLDDKGRRMMWGWAGGWWKVSNDVQSLIKAGWSGMQTLPRVVTLNKDGLLDFEPAEELKSLRGNHKELSNELISTDTSKTFDGVKSMHLELNAVIKPINAKRAGIEILDQKDSVKIYYDVVTKLLWYNQISVPLSMGRNDNIELKVFIDGSEIEVYANKRIVMTEQLKPIDANGYRIKFFAQEGRATIVKADAWEMGTIW